MIEVRQAENEFPGNVLLGPFGHTRGLLCRRHAQHCMRLPQSPSEWAERAHRRFSAIQKSGRILARLPCEWDRATELRSIGEKLYGLLWQTKLARASPANPRTVRPWPSGDRKIRPLVAAVYQNSALR